MYKSECNRVNHSDGFQYNYIIGYSRGMLLYSLTWNFKLDYKRSCKEKEKEKSATEGNVCKNK